jgi:hypothetical protein
LGPSGLVRLAIRRLSHPADDSRRTPWHASIAAAVGGETGAELGWLSRADEAAEVLCQPRGKMRQNKLRMILEDLMDVDISPYDLAHGG